MPPKKNPWEFQRFSVKSDSLYVPQYYHFCPQFANGKSILISKVCHAYLLVFIRTAKPYPMPYLDLLAYTACKYIFMPRRKNDKFPDP